MQFSDVSIPEIYKESADFRTFLTWFSECLTKVKYDTENTFDLYDPQRCKDSLLWMLADTMGFKYDDRLPTAFNRLVLLYFMSMIRNRGSKDGVTLAAETNLAQFQILMDAGGYKDDRGKWVEGKEILYNRLENTSIPVNSVYVTPHVEDGYIDIVYFSTKLPIDACIEYVRPLGMYCFQSAGVRFDARTKVSIDARLTNIDDIGISIGSTHVGHYRREDYARMQQTLSQDLLEDNTMDGYYINKRIVTDVDESGNTVITDTYYQILGADGTVLKDNIPTEKQAVGMIPNYDKVDPDHKRHPVYYRNSKFEGQPNDTINPGYRAMHSLQLANNDHVVQSLIDPIFSLGYGPQNVDTIYPDNYLKDGYWDKPERGYDPMSPIYAWNLRYDKDLEIEVDKGEAYTIDDDRSDSIINPRPAVNPIMGKLGDAISLNSDNTQYTKVVTDDQGNDSIVIENLE